MACFMRMPRYVRCDTCVVQVSDVNGLVERLLMFLESGYDHIVAETLIQLRDLLRRYPDLGQVSPYQITCALLYTSTPNGTYMQLGLVGTASACSAHHSTLVSPGALAWCSKQRALCALGVRFTWRMGVCFLLPLWCVLMT
jgi:hypothetical protein